MAEYSYPNDGRTHTRYSDLVKCTDAAAAIEIAEQNLGIRVRHDSEAMRFGRDRHEQFKEETDRTGLTPQVFKDELGYQFEVEINEKTLTSSPFDDVVIWFTIDAVKKGGDRLADYKTSAGNGSEYRSSIQLPIYAFLLLEHKLHPSKGDYLVEQWDKDRTEILGYHLISVDLGLKEYAAAKRWLRSRIGIYRAALEIAREDAEAKGWTEADTSAIV